MQIDFSVDVINKSSNDTKILHSKFVMWIKFMTAADCVDLRF